MMSLLRVALLLPGLGRVQRGAETAFIELACGLATEADVRVQLFGSGREGLDGLEVHDVPCIGRHRFERWPRLPTLRGDTYYEELSWVLNLVARRAFRPNDFDVAVTCCYPWVNWFQQRAGRKNGPKNIFVTQNGDWPCLRRNSEYKAFACDGLVCTNPEYYERQRTHYPSVLIPNGVDPDVFAPVVLRPDDVFQDPRIPVDKPVILMASAMIPTKRVGDGVRAASLVSDAFLVVVGDGPERKEITRLAQELLPDRHLLLGSMPRERMAAIFRRADVFLHMSQEEPFGIVYLEAAASGLAIVAHDGPNPRWILGETALFANTSDLEAVAASIRTATRPSAKSTLGESARERVSKDWTWRQQSRRYRQFFEKILVSGHEPGQTLAGPTVVTSSHSHIGLSR